MTKQQATNIFSVENLFKAFISLIGLMLTILGFVIVNYWGLYTRRQNEILADQKEYNRRTTERINKIDSVCYNTRSDVRELKRYYENQGFTKKTVTVIYSNK